MTAQISDKILYNGEMLSLASEPLAIWLHRNNTSEIKRSFFGSCWRGYVATWKIFDNKLFLIKIDYPLFRLRKSKSKNESIEIDNLMEKLFPNQSEVFANWFTGTLKIQKGEMLEYVHLGYESVYETDICIRFENGEMIEELTFNNTQNGNISER